MRAQARARSGAPGWKEIAFKIVAGLWILNAAFEIIQGLGVIPAFMPVFGLKEYLVVMGVIDLILGIGLYVENDLAMSVVKFRCILGLLNGFFGCLFAFAWQDKPAVMIVMLLVGIFNLAFTGFQIWIISQFSD